MPRLLLTWVGDTDLRGPGAEKEGRLGPIATALDALPFERVVLLTDRDPRRVFRLKGDGPEVQVERYRVWLGKRTKAEVTVRHAPLSSPTSYQDIFLAARKAIDELRGPKVEMVFHVSPGTPSMGAIWLLLAKTYVQAELIEGSAEKGVSRVNFPFELSAEFLPDLLRRHDEELQRLAAAPAPEHAAFTSILHRSEIMRRLLARARRVAVRSVPVLIEGESGTGKELLARAIHDASPRRAGPFVAMNCGAISETLIESELFGHAKGAFTGADRDRRGYFEQASGGTLFLDEIGELPRASQVKLLRPLQEGEIVRVGKSDPVKVDVRIIAATNRTMIDEVSAGRFREDLFYRLAVATLRMPPLRERGGDIGLLIEGLLKRLDEAWSTEPGYTKKKLSPGARNVLLRHAWPGNVREMANTLQRAVIWSEGDIIEADDARDALLTAPAAVAASVLGRPLGDGLDLQELLAEVARHYLERAMAEAGGSKTKAAELVGLPSYQTLSNWLERYDVSSTTHPPRR
jgi:DNA-binding NtrC family response regulator